MTISGGVGVGEELPVWVNGEQRRVTGVTKTTTCAQVVQALVESQCQSSDQQPEENDSWRRFAMVERWRRVERPLEADTKILKLWRRWGDEQRHVRLLIRKINKTTTPSLKGATQRSNKSRLLPSLFPKTSRKKSSTRGVKPVSLVVPRPDRRLIGKRASISSADGLKSTLFQAEVSATDQLRRLVAVQKDTLRRQRRHLARADAAIDEHETQVHLNRVAHMGIDYVQEVYLGEDGEADFLTTFLTDGSKERLRSQDERDYDEVEISWSKYSDLSQRLEEERDHIRDLGERIRLQKIEGANNNKCLEKARTELQRLFRVSESQNATVEQNSRTQNECERLLSEKGEACRRMEAEERHLDAQRERLTAARVNQIENNVESETIADNANSPVSHFGNHHQRGSWRQWRRKRHLTSKETPQGTAGVQSDSPIRTILNTLV